MNSVSSTMATRFRGRRARFWIIGLLLTPPLSAITALGFLTPSTISVEGLQALVVILPVTVAAASLVAMRGGIGRYGFSRLGSLIFSGGLLLAVALPGAQLLAGARTSTLSNLNFGIVDFRAAIALAYSLMLLALVAFVIGQETVALLDRRPRAWTTLTKKLASHDADSPATYLVLLALGTLANLPLINTAASLQNALATRGQTRGLGILELPQYAIPLCISMGICHKHWNQRRLVILSSAAFVIFLVGGGIRTPLLIIGAAIVLRGVAFASKPGNTLRTLAPAVVVMYVGATLAVAMSAWRAAVVENPNASFTSAVVDATQNPFGALAAAGLDTLDGLILSTKVAPSAVAATWTDPGKAFLNLVPYQLWPDKPTFLGPMVTHRYTDIGGPAGIFLSGPGYFLIIFGGVPGMVLGCLCLGGMTEFFLRRWKVPSAAATIYCYFLIRMLFAGDAFDISNALQIALLFLFAYFLVSLGSSLARGRQQTRRTGHEL